MAISKSKHSYQKNVEPKNLDLNENHTYFCPPNPKINKEIEKPNKLFSYIIIIH